MVAKETLPQVETSLTQSKALDLELLNLSNSSMVKLRLELNCQREIGSGRRFGCSQRTTLTDNGLLLERSISLNREETLHPAILEEETSLAQLCIGAQDIQWTLGTRHMLNTLLPTGIYLTTSMYLEWTGLKNISKHLLMVKLFSISILTKICSQKEDSPAVSTTPGNMKLIRAHLSTRSSSLFSTLLLEEQTIIGLTVTVQSHGPTLISMLSTHSTAINPLGLALGITQLLMILQCKSTM